MESRVTTEESLVATAIAAKSAGLSTGYLYKNADRIPAAHRAGRALRWDIIKLKEWMRDQAVRNGKK